MNASLRAVPERHGEPVYLSRAARTRSATSSTSKATTRPPFRASRQRKTQSRNPGGLRRGRDQWSRRPLSRCRPRAAAAEPPVRSGQLLLPARGLLRRAGLLSADSGQTGEPARCHRHSPPGGSAVGPRPDGFAGAGVQQPRRHDVQALGADGRSDPAVQALVYFTQATEIADSLSRSPDTVQRSENRSLPSLNMRGILYPVTGFVLQPFSALPKDFEAITW